MVVKSYPRPSLTHGETACVAGLLEGTRWVRLYPVLFRELPRPHQFHKWQWITCRLTKSRSDPRTESWTPDHDSVVVGDQIPSSSVGWAQRLAYLQQVPEDTIEALKGRPDRSLGWIRPWRVDGFEYAAETGAWPARYALRQQRLWGDSEQPLEPLPYTFYVRFSCDALCPGHRLSLVDWEVYQLFRNVRSPDVVITRLETIHQTRALSFFVGTALRTHAYGAYMVVGIFYPPQRVPGLLSLE